MDHRDAQLSDIIVVLKADCADKFDDAVAALKQMEMEVEEADADNGVVEGTISSDKLAAVRKWPCVDYVRVEFSYIADYPPGDPRNLDPVEPSSESED